MKLFRVEVMIEAAGGSRWHDGRAFLAVGETAEEAARRAMDAYLQDNPRDLMPVGAIAEEIEGMAHALPMAVEAVLKPDMKKLARREGWVSYESVATGPRP
ncbi:hypothetical protein [Methylobacterium radiotolerans]|uniref:hypothetical protein n=1 Tax=Methylobacterium radiotolerans TaxID=31998 RepID=UPI0038D0A46E